MRPLKLTVVLLFLIVGPALADTIVLKNGRRIFASNINDDGTHVSFETRAGRMSLPKSIVLRIEHGSDGSATFGALGAAALEVAPPRVDAPANVPNYGELARLTVHDGSVDQDYLARLDTQARGGAPGAVARAVAAHNIAAGFLLGKGDADRAIEQCRSALELAPENLTSLLNVSYLYLRRSEYTTALDFLERARRVAPDSPDAAKLAGWAYYGTNKLDDAVKEWKRALHLRGDPDVRSALERAERDQKVESQYREQQTAHFTLRYSGAENPALAREILRTLEQDFRGIESALNYTPLSSIAVILYTEETFTDVTHAPAWAGATNDGRLHIPIEGLSSMTPELAHVLRHELTHSFIHQKTLGRCPRWLDEGIAEWVEGERSGDDAAALAQGYENAQKAGMSSPLLARLEGSWAQFSSEDAAAAYAWSLAVVEAIVDAGGSGDLGRLLDRVATGSSTEAALRDALHSDYSDLEKQTADYLRRAYLR